MNISITRRQGAVFLIANYCFHCVRIRPSGVILDESAASVLPEKLGGVGIINLNCSAHVRERWRAKNIAKRVKSGAKLATSVINYAHTTFIALLETRSPGVWVAGLFFFGRRFICSKKTSAAQDSSCCGRIYLTLETKRYLLYCVCIKFVSPHSPKFKMKFVEVCSYAVKLANTKNKLKGLSSRPKN